MNYDECGKKTSERLCRLKQIIIETASESTIHSIPQIFKRKNRLLRIFWLISFVTFAALSGHMISKSVIDYYNFETITKAQTVYENPTAFPVVTICNQNPYMTEYAFDYVRDFLVVNNLTPIDDLIVHNFSRVITLMRYGVGVTLRSSTNVTDDMRKRMGLQIDEMLLNCNYNNQPCSSRDFTWHFDSLYGSCYSFNSGIANETEPPLETPQNERIVTKSGSFNGLTLELFVGEPTNIFSLSYTTGAHVIIHNRTVEPKFYDGMSVSVGQCTNIAVSRLFSSQLEQPYSDCIRDVKTFARSSRFVRSLLDANQAYRQADCFDVCLQKYVVDYCNCYTIEFEYWNKSQVQPCQTIHDLLCYGYLLVEFFSNDVKTLCPNDCPPECDSLTYTTQLSTSTYPSAVYGDLLVKKNSAIRARFNNRTNVTLEELRRNILAINVYYATMSYQSISESEKMNYVDLISTVGGTLGLFLGMSFLSFFEFIDLILHIIWTLVRTLRNNNNSTSNSNQTILENK